MNKPSPILTVIAILSALEHQAGGLTVPELASLLSSGNEDRIKPWLEKLVQDRWLIVTGGNRAQRYALAPGVAADLPRLRAEQANATPAPQPVNAPSAAAVPAGQPVPPTAAPATQATTHPQQPTNATARILPTSEVENRDSNIENPSTPQSEIRTPQSPSSAVRDPQFSPPTIAPPVPAARVDPAPEFVTFAQMYPLAVLDIVGGGMDREAARYGLRRQALRNGNDPASASAYVANALAQLDALTCADAESFGVSRPQYELWRSRWPASAPGDATPSSRDRTNATGASQPKDNQTNATGASRPQDPSNPQSEIRNPHFSSPPVRPPPTSPSATSEIENRDSKIENPRSARDRLRIAWRDLKAASGIAPGAQPLTLGAAAASARQLWSKRITFYGHTLTVARAVVASVWAALWLAYVQRHIAVGAAVGGMLSYVVAALPWLVFRLFDGGFTWLAGGQAVLVGGTVSYVLALPSRPLAEWLFGVTPRAFAAIAALFAATPHTESGAATTAWRDRPNATGASQPQDNQTNATGASRPQDPSTLQLPSGVAFTPPPPPAHAPVEPPATAPTQPEPVDPDMAVPATEPAAATEGDATPSSHDRTNSTGSSRPQDNQTNATGASRPQDPSIPQSEIRNPQSPPPFPATTGAYVLVNHAWVALPRNNGGIIKSAVQAANGWFGKLNRFENELAGKTPTTSADIVGDLVFSGRDEAPPAPAAALVVAYVGPLALNAKFVADYPMVQLDDVYALMELAPLQAMNNGNRYTPMCAVFGDLNDFGPRRLPATVESAGPNITVLRCTAALPAGRYALACGKQYYELQVK